MERKHRTIDFALRIYNREGSEGKADREAIDGSSIDKYSMPFFEDVDSARIGFRKILIELSNVKSNRFITVETAKGKDPKIYAGIIDTDRISEFDILYRKDVNHLSVPVVEKCSFSLRRQPLVSSERSDVPIKIVRRKEGYTPRVFLGTNDEMKDVITRPTYDSESSFRTFLARLHPNMIKPEDDRILLLANNIFQYFEFEGEDRLINDR